VPQGADMSALRPLIPVVLRTVLVQLGGN